MTAITKLGRVAYQTAQRSWPHLREKISDLSYYRSTELKVGSYFVTTCTGGFLYGAYKNYDDNPTASQKIRRGIQAGIASPYAILIKVLVEGGKFAAEGCLIILDGTLARKKPRD